MSNPILVFLGVHATALDDTQALSITLRQIAVLHWVAHLACVQCANEEGCCEGLEPFGWMPVGGYPLSILFAVFHRCLAILRDKPVKHV